MSVNTLVKDGLLVNINQPVKVLDLSGLIGDEWKNPGMCRDDSGNTWISVRSCVITPERWEGYEHPNHYQNHLLLGKFDEDKLEVVGMKEIVPEEDYVGFQWGIEDVRLFWREDGLHGIGVIIPIVDGGYKIRQAEILIDYEKGTYKYIKDHGRPFGHAEKNWSPTQEPNPHFDFVYSPTQIVKDDKVIGTENELIIHNGSPLIPFEQGYISVAHIVASVKGERTYVTLALKFNEKGALIEHSQLFHFNVGWRPKLNETVEFVSSLIWVKDKEGEELLAGLGVKDELVGVVKIPIEKLEWHPYVDTIWYSWQYDTRPSRVEFFG